MGIQTDTRAIWIPFNGGIENEKLYAPLLRDTTTARWKLKCQMGKDGGLGKSFEIQRLDSIEIVVI